MIIEGPCSHCCGPVLGLYLGVLSEAAVQARVIPGGRT